MKTQTAVVLGATGLIGNQLVELLLADASFTKVRVLVRRPIAIQHGKLEIQIVNFNDIDDYKQKLRTGDSIFCCVGTTQNKVKGDKDAYRKVDFDIPVNAAKLGAEAGFTKFLLVSSVGAKEGSKNFYLQLKGEVENAVSKYSYQSIAIFRPSILLGKRSETRLAERIAKGFMKALSSLFVGAINKYKAIQARDVARAMIAASKKDTGKVKIYQYKEMMELIKQDQHQE